MEKNAKDSIDIAVANQASLEDEDGNPSDINDWSRISKDEQHEYINRK